MFEKLLLKRVKPLIEEKKLTDSRSLVWIQNKHSTIGQAHRISNILEEALEAKNAVALLLDVAQAFDKAVTRANTQSRK